MQYSGSCQGRFTKDNRKTPLFSKYERRSEHHLFLCELKYATEKLTFTENVPHAKTISVCPKSRESILWYAHAADADLMLI